MTFPLLSTAFWAASAVGHIVLLVTLFRRKLPNTRVLMTYLGFAPIESFSLFLVATYGNRHVYAIAYSVFGVFSYALQLSILYELARSSLKPLGHVLKPKVVGLSVAFGALVLSLIALACAATLDSKTLIDVWENRVSVFVSLSICIVIIIIFVLMNRFYLSLKRQSLVIAQGLFVWHYSLLMQDCLHTPYAVTYTHLKNWYGPLDYTVEVIYLLVLVYWIFALKKSTGSLQPIPEDVRAKILSLHTNLENTDARKGL